MKCTVKWLDGAMFIGESGSGHSVVMDGPEDLGGRNLALRPMEMLLLGRWLCYLRRDIHAQEVTSKCCRLSSRA